MAPRWLTPLLAAAALVAGAAPAQAAPAYRPGEVIVHYESGTSTAQAVATERSVGTGAAEPVAPASRVVQVRDGESVRETVRELQAQPDVAYAVPNYVARGAAFVPNDPGRGSVRRGWQSLQWNFLAAFGIDMPNAWANLIAAGAPGGRGVTVAVLDTGVAYRKAGRFIRSPDFSASQFARGYDFVSRDRFPDDHNGHGTFIAGVIGEQVNNRRAATGIAYGAKIMPVRVLDTDGLGDAATIGAGIRFAARNGARVINLSLEFDPSTPSSQIPEVISAIREANRRGVLVVAASGNEAVRRIAYPARAAGVLSVGATTEHGCQADYSNDGPGLDLVAPGGGADAPISDDPRCRPDGQPGRDIFQFTWTSSPRRFGFPSGYQGTSMATPHVSGVAALVIASGVIGRRPSIAALEQRLESTARDLGPPGWDNRYGAGLLNAAAATAPARASRRR